MNEEVVAETSKVAPEETTQTDSAQTDEKSLDQLLDEFGSEFDSDTKPPEPEQTKETAEISAAEIEEVKGFMQEQRDAATNNAVLEAAKTVKAALGEGLSVNISEQSLVDSLHGRATRDQKFLQAFVSRGENPELWDKVLTQYAKEYRESLGQPIDQQVTNDREAVVSSITGQSTAKEEAPNMDSWSDRRFQHWTNTGKDDPKL